MTIRQGFYFMLTVSGFLCFLLACDSLTPISETSTPETAAPKTSPPPKTPTTPETPPPAVSNTVTLVKYNKIRAAPRTGTTIDEVLEMMGFKETRPIITTPGGSKIHIWKQELTESKFRAITVAFRNGRAESKRCDGEFSVTYCNRTPILF